MATIFFKFACSFNIFGVIIGFAESKKRWMDVCWMMITNNSQIKTPPHSSVTACAPIGISIGTNFFNKTIISASFYYNFIVLITLAYTPTTKYFCDSNILPRLVLLTYKWHSSILKTVTSSFTFIINYFSLFNFFIILRTILYTWLINIAQRAVSSMVLAST